jgi:predicted DNA-binding protein (MmcQ/YjbR family)
MAAKAKRSAFFQRYHDLVLALPGTKLTMPWGSPHFRVGEKILTGCPENAGPDSHFSVKMDVTLQQALCASDPRFAPAPYGGKHGWVVVRFGAKPDWKEIATLVEGSYRLIAPKKLVAQLDGAKAGTRAKATPSRRARRR